MLPDGEVTKRIREIRQSVVDAPLKEGDLIFGCDDFIDYRSVTQYDIECFTRKMISILEQANYAKKSSNK